jgi:GT2 family glycosyltransferase
LHGAYGTRGAFELQRFAGVFPFGPTANLGIRRELFDRLGGFDILVNVGEDLDLCLRAWLADAELQFVPAATVHYRYREGLAGLWKQAVTYGAAAPDVARRLAAAGHPVPARWRGTKNWFWLIRKLPTLRSKSGRARWTVVAGGSVGRMLGSIRARYVML